MPLSHLTLPPSIPNPGLNVHVHEANGNTELREPPTALQEHHGRMCANRVPCFEGEYKICNVQNEAQRHDLVQKRRAGESLRLVLHCIPIVALVTQSQKESKKGLCGLGAKKRSWSFISLTPLPDFQREK